MNKKVFHCSCPIYAIGIDGKYKQLRKNFCSKENGSTLSDNEFQKYMLSNELPLCETCKNKFRRWIGLGREFSQGNISREEYKKKILYLFRSINNGTQV